MNQILIAALVAACFVLAVDLVITRVRVRQRARPKSVTPEPPPTEEELGGEPNEGVAIE
jgi:organic hydroperoxide reductase OsmC/OhrA